MISNFCTSCSSHFEIPQHYVGKMVTCPTCRKEFRATAAGGASSASTASPTIQKRRANESTTTDSRFTGTDPKRTLPLKIALVAVLVVLVSLAIGIPMARSSAKKKEFRAKYEEFVFEADQLSNLTDYGVNKSDFGRQLARVEAKWSAVPSEGFRDNSYGNFDAAISKWREVVRWWGIDSDEVPSKMLEASQRYQQAKTWMR